MSAARSDVNPVTRVYGARTALRIPAPAVRAPALPRGADLRIPGLSPFITPNQAFYRVDTTLVLPQVSHRSRASVQSGRSI